MSQREQVINPRTGRLIYVDGRTFRLVAEAQYNWLERQCANPPDPTLPKYYYCGTKRDVPSGYVKRGSPYNCLKKGFKTGLCKAFSKIK